MLPTTADAVAASVAVADTLGLPTDSPVVVAEGYSVRVHLNPAPVLTRVVTVGRTLRGNPLPWMQREIDVARHLAAAGAPVAPPWRDPGPHSGAGLDVSLWTWLEPATQGISPAVFGGLLKRLHDALLSYTPELPVLIGPLTDIAAARHASDDLVLHQAAEYLVPLALTWPRRPLHGDAHVGNILSTQHGPLWTDFEDVCVGPLEWDLASRTVTDEHVQSYPDDVNADRLDQCRALRDLQILSAVLTDDIQDPSLYRDVTGRLGRWRG